MKKLLILVLMLCSLVLVSCGGKKESSNVADIKTPNVLPTPAPVQPESDEEKQANFEQSLESFNGLDSSKLDSLLPAQRPEVVIPELNLGAYSFPTSKMEVYASQDGQDVKMMDGYLWQVEDTIYAGMNMGMGATSMSQVAKIDLGDLSVGLNAYLKSMEEVLANATENQSPSELINEVLAEVGLTLDDILSLLHFEPEDFEYKGKGKFVLKNEALARVVANAVNALDPKSGVSAQMLLAMLQQFGIELEISFTYANQHITNVNVSVKGNVEVPNGEQTQTIKIDVELEVKFIYGETDLLGFGFGLDASVIGDKATGLTLKVSCDLAASLNGLTLEADIETGKALKDIDATAALVLTQDKVVVALDAKVEDLADIEFKLSADKDKFSLNLDYYVVNTSYSGYYDEEKGEYVEEVVKTPVKAKANVELTKSKVSAQLVVDGREMLKVNGTLENNWFKNVDIKVLSITHEWDEQNNTDIVLESTMKIKLTSVGVTVPQDLLGMQDQAFDVVPKILEGLTRE